MSWTAATFHYYQLHLVWLVTAQYRLTPVRLAGCNRQLSGLCFDSSWTKENASMFSVFSPEEDTCLCYCTQKRFLTSSTAYSQPSSTACSQPSSTACSQPYKPVVGAKAARLQT